MKKVLSLALAFTLAFTIVPTNVFAEGEGETVAPIALACDAENVVACIGEVGYATLQEAINAGDEATVVLKDNVTESIVIEEGKNVTLNLNDFKITNVDGSHTITNKGTLVIEGKGTVDNVSHAKAALYNETGNVTINDGVFTRSLDASGNTYYVIVNGCVKDNFVQTAEMTINGGTVKSEGTISSLIINVHKLTVNNGYFSNNFTVLKNETESTMTVNGGIITAPVQSIQNAGDTLITGGNITGNVSNTPYKTYKTSVSITGGTITGNVAMWDAWNSAEVENSIVIDGGIVTGEVKVIDKDKNPITESEKLNIDVKKGTFADASAVNYLTEGANVTVDLQADVTNSIVVPANTNVTLNLNGHKVSNTDGQHTITNNGTLVINGEGLVDNTSHGRGAVLNNGNLTVNGGEFTRSKEAGFKPGTGGNGGNSWYVISNEKGGVATFNGGNVHSTGKHSSLVRNYGDMTINNGDFSNGFIAVKNEEESTLKIAGGRIAGSQSVQTYGTTEIAGGTLSGQVSVNNYEGFDSKATITGGQINGDVVAWDDDKATGTINAIIDGGNVDGSLVVWDTNKQPIDESAKLNIDVQKGTFTDANSARFVVDGRAAVGVDGTLHVGSAEDAQTAVNSAKNNVEVFSGVDAIKVPEGVTVKNNSGEEITVNGTVISDGDSVEIKPEVTPTPEAKPQVEAPKAPVYDDGGPFTTDECGSVYDRWGNLMWKAPTCKAQVNGNYNLVNTSDR